MSINAAGETADGVWRNRIFCADNLSVLKKMPSCLVSLIYIDPPFNTGKRQQRTRIKTTAATTGGDRTGFGGKRYHTEVIGESGYDDAFTDYRRFLRLRLKEAYRVLKPNGSLFFHIDWREAARCRLLLEKIFGGDDRCMNEIIWAYDYGARSRRRWSTKHDNLYWFVKDPKNYIFNYGEIDRIPYMAPALAGEEKAARGKTPTDTWWNTIVATRGKEKTGYPTQKPLAILERIIRVHSCAGDIVLDFFAGSGTTGEAAAKHDRAFVLIDNNPAAAALMKKRLAGVASPI